MISNDFPMFPFQIMWMRIQYNKCGINVVLLWAIRQADSQKLIRQKLSMLLHRRSYFLNYTCGPA